MNQREIFPRSLQYLIAIAEYGSFTRAAEALHVSQPSLSQQIKHLEECLDSSLLERNGRTVRLTDTGEIYLRHARRAWGELNAGGRAIHDVKNLSRGTLRLGWTPITDHLACPLLEQFNNHYPGISLTTLEMPQDDIKTAVIEDHIDIGITFSRHFSSNNLSREIETYKLFDETLMMAIGKSHPRYGKQKEISAHELGHESLAMLNTSFALRHHFDIYCMENKIEPRVTVDTNSLNVIIEMVQLGPLATILPSSIIRTECGLYPIAIVPMLPIKEINLVCRKGIDKTPACQAFTQLAMDWANNRLKATPVKRRKPCPLSEAIS